MTATNLRWRQFDVAVATRDHTELESLYDEDAELFGAYIHHVAAAGDIARLSFMDELFELPSFLNENEENVLFTAVLNHQPQLVTFLLQTHKRTLLWDQNNVNGQNVLQLAIKDHDLSIVEQLVQHGPHLIVRRAQPTHATAFELAISEGFVEAMELMLQREPTVLSILVPKSNENVLHCAVRSRCLKSLEFLLQHCPKSLIVTHNERLPSFTPFHFAIKCEQFKMVKLLLEACPNALDVHSHDFDHVPPFFTSAQCESLEIFYYLLDTYPRLIHQCDITGRNVLAYLNNPNVAAQVVAQNPQLLTMVDNQNQVAAYDSIRDNHVPMLQFFFAKHSRFVVA